MTSIEERFSKIEQEGKFQWLAGARARFLQELRSQLNFVNGDFRLRSGARINFEVYVKDKIEAGNFLKEKPSAKDIYHPAYPIRTAEQKGSHRKFTEALLKKAIQIDSYKFVSTELEQRAIEIISSNFLPTDTEDGLKFSRISDTPVGSFPGTEKYSLSDLFATIAITDWIDKDATSISQLQHAATLRNTAANMLGSDAKKSAVENLVKTLDRFERRSLKTNKFLPEVPAPSIESEFVKYNALSGHTHSGSLATARIATNNLNDLSDLRNAVRSIEITQKSEPYF